LIDFICLYIVVSNSTPEEFEYVDCPRIKDADEVRLLMGGVFDNVPEDYAFTKWLLDN
jgi:hypothetical protein